MIRDLNPFRRSFVTLFWLSPHTFRSEYQLRRSDTKAKMCYETRLGISLVTLLPQIIAFTTVVSLCRDLWYHLFVPLRQTYLQYWRLIYLVNFFFMVEFLNLNGSRLWWQKSKSKLLMLSEMTHCHSQVKHYLFHQWD